MKALVTAYADQKSAILAFKQIRKIMRRRRTGEGTQRPGARNIRLGLERIQHATGDRQPWIGVHVGGTNGKGSICAFLAGLFKMHGLSFGTYTSPALPERHHSITIQDRYISKELYERSLERADRIYQKNTARWKYSTEADLGDLTPFELETAAAFKIFRDLRVQFGIVEVGMGGGTDATNVMLHKGVTVISKIGLDHQEFLGRNILSIAAHKAGIMRRAVPCVVDSDNSEKVINVLMEKAAEVGTRLIMSDTAQDFLATLDTEAYPLEPYQVQNLSCAVLAFRHLFPHLQIDVNKLLSMDPFPLGRTELVNIESLSNGTRQLPILVDGAHNTLGMVSLARYVNTRLRNGEEPVTWVIGMSQSRYKSFSELLETILCPQDHVAIVEYEPQPGVPPPAAAEMGREYVRSVLASEEQSYDGAVDITSALRWACTKSPTGPVVVTGSLYLLRQLYNLDDVVSSRRKELYDNFLVSKKSKARLERLLQPIDEGSEDSEEMEGMGDNSQLATGILPPTDDQEASSSQSSPPGLSPYSAAAQEEADFHRERAARFASEIKVTEQKIRQAVSGGQSEESAYVAGLLDKLKQLEAVRLENRAAYVRAKCKAEAGRPQPKKDSMSNEQLLAWWREQRAKTAQKNPFVQYSEPGFEGRTVSGDGQSRDIAVESAVEVRDSMEEATTTVEEGDEDDMDREERGEERRW